jgi:hypothetical protein
MTLINELPNCINYEKCGRQAFTLINHMWVCGDCLIKLQEKLKKLKENLLLEE